MRNAAIGIESINDQHLRIDGMADTASVHSILLAGTPLYKNRDRTIRKNIH